VIAARDVARLRQRCPNAELGPAAVRRHARLTREARKELASGHRRMALSGRGYDRVLRVARTVADLSGSGEVNADHVATALSFRRRNAE
jgi:magnesium chelatase family protein